MAVSSRDVAEVLRARIPGLPTKKLHKLLYYCQGHHLATQGEALFTESVSAWDMGPVVGSLWYQEKQGGERHAPSPLSEAQLNTVGYVVSRYGQLSGRDLENLTHSESPWQLANRERRPGQSARIEHRWMEAYFDSDGEDDDGEALLDTHAVATWLEDAEQRRAEQLRPDSYDEIRARLARA